MARRDEWVEDDIVFEDESAQAPRPYLLTGGRTRSDVDGLAFETLVEKSGVNSGDRSLRFENAKVLDLCDAPISIAEISAHLSIPLGSTMVMIGDLVSSGHLLSHRTISAASDVGVSLVKRILRGVQKL